MGRLGEDIALKYLLNKGYSFIDRNYRKRYGEIDIVMKKSGVLHFVEVKTVSTDLSSLKNEDKKDFFRPEDNVHPMKMSRLANTIKVFLEGKTAGEGADWQFDVVTVLLDERNKLAKVELLEDLVL